MDNYTKEIGMKVKSMVLESGKVPAETIMKASG